MSDTKDFEKALGLDKPDPALRALVAKCFGVTPLIDLSSAYEQKLTPRDRETRKYLTPIADAARSLEIALLKLDHVAQESEEVGAALSLKAVFDNWFELVKNDYDGLPDPISAVSALAEATETVLGNLPVDRGGQSKTFGALIIDLANIYEKATGKRAGVSHGNAKSDYSGPFFRFVDVCLASLAPDLHRRNQALGKAIQRALVTRL